MKAALPGLLAVVAACASGGWDGGIHARLAFHRTRGLRVVEVPAGPAAEAGLLPGDRIVEIDGQPLDGLTMQEVQDRLRGPVGSRVRLGVVRAAAPERPDGNAADLVRLEVVRAPYAEPRAVPGR